MKVKHLLEAETKTKSKIDLDNFDFDDLDDLLNPELKDQPLANRKDDKKSKQQDDIKLKTASKSKTADATKNVNIGAKGAEHIKNLMKNMPADVGADEPETPTTDLDVYVKPANLPAHLERTLALTGSQNPDWHLVSSLPGNVSSVIKRLGKMVFGTLTRTPTEKISMIANLGGQGPNTDKEVQAVAGYLKKNGEDLGKGDFNFDQIMPGYKADSHVFVAHGTRFLLIKDDMGQYIYAWPDNQSVGFSPDKRLENK